MRSYSSSKPGGQCRGASAGLGYVPAPVPWCVASVRSLRWYCCGSPRRGGGGGRRGAGCSGAGRVGTVAVVGGAGVVVVGCPANVATLAHVPRSVSFPGSERRVLGPVRLTQSLHRRVRIRHCRFENAAAGSTWAQAVHLFKGSCGFMWVAKWGLLGVGIRAWGGRLAPSASPASVRVVWASSLGLHTRSEDRGRATGGVAPFLPLRGPAASARAVMAAITRRMGGCARSPPPPAPGPITPTNKAGSYGQPGYSPDITDITARGVGPDGAPRPRGQGKRRCH